jgi:hypothetical protein
VHRDPITAIDVGQYVGPWGVRELAGRQRLLERPPSRRNASDAIDERSVVSSIAGHDA